MAGPAPSSGGGALLCVAPLSSPYGLLPRAHTYALVAALILPLPRGWLFRAALAAFTTRCAVFAVDAAVILATLRRQQPQQQQQASGQAGGGAAAPQQPLPLDALASLEMLALATLVATWLLFVSRTASRSSARALVRWWAVAVGVGAVLAFVAVKELGIAAAAASLGDAPTDAATAGACDHGTWLPAAALFGDAAPVPVLGTVGAKVAWVARRVGVPALLFAALALAAAVRPRPRNFTYWRWDLEGGRQAAAIKAGVDPSSSPWGVEAAEDDGVARGKWSVAAMLFNMAMVFAVPAVVVLVAVSAEQYYFTMVDLPGGMPAVEKITSVGQWGVWAATAVVVVATSINGAMELMGFKKPFTTSPAPTQPAVVADQTVFHEPAPGQLVAARLSQDKF